MNTASSTAHVEFRAYTESETFARGVARDVAQQLADAIAARGKASLVVPGGTTPGPVFDALASERSPWCETTVTLSDERWVDVDDPGSNERLVRKHLLVDEAAQARFLSWRNAASEQAAAASVLNREIAALMPFDVCMLGLGLDGHIASLVPGADGFDAAMRGDNDAAVAAVHAPGAAGAADRLTLTFPAIASSRLVILLFTGDAKRAVFENALNGEGAAPIVRLLRDMTAPVCACWRPEPNA